MTLKDIIDKLMDADDLVLVIDNHGNVEGAYYDDKEHFNEYQSCKVESIYLTGCETMVVTVDGNSKEQEKREK